MGSGREGWRKKWAGAGALAGGLLLAASAVAGVADLGSLPLIGGAATKGSAALTVVDAPVSTATNVAAANAPAGVTGASTSAAAAAAESDAILAKLKQLPAVPSNFNIKRLLIPSWGNGSLPASAAPDPHGAFRFVCNAGRLAYDDPVVYPGKPGKSHLHQFFGNTKVDAFSTYESLRRTGGSTCDNKLNRSAYWMPAMLNGKGRVVRPDYITIYYKRFAPDNPMCKVQGTACVGIPRGLRMVFGYNMANMSGPQDDVFYFQCNNGPARKTLVEAAAAASECKPGQKMLAQIGAPPCWNGKDLDSPDHRSHMAWPGYGWWGYLKCPPTHPYIVPSFTMGVWYTVDADLNTSGNWKEGQQTWHLASDVMNGMPMAKPGSTFHADWFGAWDDTVLKMWNDNCVNKMLNCSGGDLGNGLQMSMYPKFSWVADPHTIKMPKVGDAVNVSDADD